MRVPEINSLRTRCNRVFWQLGRGLTGVIPALRAKPNSQFVGIDELSFCWFSAHVNDPPSRLYLDVSTTYRNAKSANIVSKKNPTARKINLRLISALACLCSGESFAEVSRNLSSSLRVFLRYSDMRRSGPPVSSDIVAQTQTWRPLDIWKAQGSGSPEAESSRDGILI